jgi:hypothetical protein
MPIWPTTCEELVAPASKIRLIGNQITELRVLQNEVDVRKRPGSKTLRLVNCRRSD